MAVSSLLAFWTVALLLIVVPGADWAFIINAGLRGRSILPAVSGLVVGYAVVTLVVAAGVGALVAGSPTLLTGLTVIGGLYLIWHGATTFAHPASPGLPPLAGSQRIRRIGQCIEILGPVTRWKSGGRSRCHRAWTCPKRNRHIRGRHEDGSTTSHPNCGPPIARSLIAPGRHASECDFSRGVTLDVALDFGRRVGFVVTHLQWRGIVHNLWLHLRGRLRYRRSSPDCRSG